MTTAGLRHRYEAVTALRWLGVGAVAPFVFLLMLERGLSLAAVGGAVAVYGITVAALELPTGGLADALGRRPVLAVASAVTIAATFLLFVATDFGVFVAAWALLGIGRALDSGALEAWFVDASLDLEPGVDLRPGLARGEVAGAIALAAGSLLGGFLPTVLPEPSPGAHLTPLSMTVLVGAGTAVAHLVAVLLLVDEPRLLRRGSIGDAVRDVPAVVRGALGLAGRHRGLRLLLLSSAVIGTTANSLEVLWQPRFSELSGSTDTRLFGIVGAAIFLAAALGAGSVPRIVRRFRAAGGRIALAAHTGSALAMLALAATATVVPAAVAMSLIYVFLGVRLPVHNELLHRRVPSAQRSTMLSADSLALQLGGFLSALVIPGLAAVWGIPLMWGAVAVALGLAGAVYPAVARSDEHAAGAYAAEPDPG